MPYAKDASGLKRTGRPARRKRKLVGMASSMTYNNVTGATTGPNVSRTYESRRTPARTAPPRPRPSSQKRTRAKRTQGGNVLKKASKIAGVTYYGM